MNDGINNTEAASQYNSQMLDLHSSKLSPHSLQRPAIINLIDLGYNVQTAAASQSGTSTDNSAQQTALELQEASRQIAQLKAKLEEEIGKKQKLTNVVFDRNVDIHELSIENKKLKEQLNNGISNQSQVISDEGEQKISPMINFYESEQEEVERSPQDEIRELKVQIKGWRSKYLKEVTKIENNNHNEIESLNASYIQQISNLDRKRQEDITSLEAKFTLQIDDLRKQNAELKTQNNDLASTLLVIQLSTELNGGSHLQPMPQQPINHLSPIELNPPSVKFQRNNISMQHQAEQERRQLVTENEVQKEEIERLKAQIREERAQHSHTLDQIKRNHQDQIASLEFISNEKTNNGFKTGYILYMREILARSEYLIGKNSEQAGLHVGYLDNDTGNTTMQNNEAQVEAHLAYAGQYQQNIQKIQRIQKNLRNMIDIIDRATEINHEQLFRSIRKIEKELVSAQLDYDEITESVNEYMANKLQEAQVILQTKEQMNQFYNRAQLTLGLFAKFISQNKDKSTDQNK